MVAVFFSAALDIRKAFDTVNHFKMFSVLISKGIPLLVINVLRNWYRKLCGVVRWHGVLSGTLKMREMKIRDMKMRHQK